MKLIFLVFLISLTANSKQTIDYEKLADAIRIHENSKHFPYGIEVHVSGKLSGLEPAKARQVCIGICRRSYQSWNGQGDFFQTLNQVYAKDKLWHLDVEKIYNQKTKIQ